MREELAKLNQLLLKVRNPAWALLDRLGIQQGPYVLRLRDGMVIELRPATGDLFGFYEIVLRGDYLAGGQRIERGQIVVDVGANIGCFAVTAARQVGPTGHVFAIEPEETTYQQLLRNIELNQLRNVTALRMAVGSTEGEITLHGDSNRLFSSIYTTVNGRAIAGATQRVPVTTLDKLLKTQGIERCHYLKLDCEGAEHDIIASMSFETARQVDVITMEVHKVPGHDGETLRCCLETLGYVRVGSSTLPFYALPRSVVK